MSDRAALVAAVATAPDDDLPKLVFADWLEENGDPDRGEFVRLAVAVHREANSFPPAHDPAKRDRLIALFDARHRDWLRPVYDALGQPPPTFTAPQDRWSVQSLGGIVISHPNGPMPAVVFHAGLVSLLSLQLARLPASASLAAAMTHEPLDVLHLTVPTARDEWERFDGPHLARVRALRVQFDELGGREVGAVAEVLCDPARFRGLREFTVTPEVWGGDGAPGAVLFDTLCGSPLRRQLTALSLYDLPGTARLLARADHGFDALRELAVGTRGQRGGADALFAGGVSDWFRERLTRLVIDTSATQGLGWLTAGQPWEHLEKLSLSGGGVDDAGAATLAQTDALPALRELRLSRTALTPAGATLLASSPLVTRLRVLFLDGSAVTDIGAASLAAALDTGLTYLSLRDCQPALSPRLVRDLTARFGPRIAFG